MQLWEIHQNGRNYYLTKKLKHNYEFQECSSLSKIYSPSVLHIPPSDEEIGILTYGVESLFKESQEISPNEMNCALGYLSHFMDNRNPIDTHLIWKDINSEPNKAKGFDSSQQILPILTKKNYLSKKIYFFLCGDEYIFLGLENLTCYSIHKKWEKSIAIQNFSNPIFSTNGLLYFIDNNRSISSINPTENNPQVPEFTIQKQLKFNNFKISDTVDPLFAVYSSKKFHLHYGNTQCYYQYLFESPIKKYDLDSKHLYFANENTFSYAEEDRIVSSVNFDHEITSFSLTKNSNTVLCFGENNFSLLDLRICAEISSIRSENQIYDLLFEEFSSNFVLIGKNDVFLYDIRYPEIYSSKIHVPYEFKAEFIKNSPFLAIASSDGKCVLYDANVEQIKEIVSFNIGCSQIKEIKTTKNAVFIQQENEINMLQIGTKKIHLPNVI